MDVTTDKAIKEQFDLLPEEIKILLANEEWLTRVTDVARKYNLNNEQAEGLRQETFFVLLCLEPLSAYRNNLVRETGISYDQALKIASDINAQILGPVMQTLREIEKELRGAKTDTPEYNPAILQVSKPQPVRTGIETHPDHMIPDHDEMERSEGIHLHSQTVMPSLRQGQQNVSRPVVTGSIIDQKLKSIVRSAGTPPANLPTDEKDLEQIVGERPNPYKGNDPYREPLE